MAHKPDTWRWSQIILHWVCALLVLGLFLLGDYMVELDYYDQWYRQAPFWHRSFGLLLLVLFILRFIDIVLRGKPKPINLNAAERFAAAAAHYLFYILVSVACISGYLISSADGRGVSFFDWFELPAIITGVDRLEDGAGLVHEYSVDALMILAFVHALAAFKHHFYDRDDTLLRILYRR